MTKKRNILLIEPGYKNKYPPIGLMKIATYHRRLGDNVVFYKGNVKEFTINQTVSQCIEKLNNIDNSIDWKKQYEAIFAYIKTNHSTKLKNILSNLKDSNNTAIFKQYLEYFANSHKKREYGFKWDRIYITTLFTFYWNITIQVIQDSKFLVRNISDIKVGGILASLLAKEVEETTGITPTTGLLDKSGMLDDNNIIVDDLPLDYSILDEIDYQYPTGSAYFTFMTKGCTRKCAFCSVPKLEPTYKEKIPTQDKFLEIKQMYGEQQHLLLMDNNVLASPRFSEIIQEIKDMGFIKGAKFIESNQLDIAIKNLKSGHNDKAYINKSYRLIENFIERRVKGKTRQEVYDICDKFKLLKQETVDKNNLIKAYEHLKVYYEHYRHKRPKNRYVDFNQGVDARYITDENMKLLSQIPIYPLRIAFDYIGLRKRYEQAVRLAAKYKISRLSNYLLFNFKDKPADLYNRMRINIDLSEELGIHIYSFPMKFIPLFGEDAKNRDYISQPQWNKKFVRAIQAISNVTRGIVPPGRSFFERAYGKSEEEYFELLYMPEAFIVYRDFFEKKIKITNSWRMAYHTIKQDEKLWFEAKNIIEENNFRDLEAKTQYQKVLNFLQYYKITRDDVEVSKGQIMLQNKINDLIRNDQFIDLTLTYDQDNSEYEYTPRDKKKDYIEIKTI